MIKTSDKEGLEDYLSRIEQPKFTKSASQITEEESKLRVLDLNIVESEIREVQAGKYCGDIVFSFEHGMLKPICRLNRTKKII